MKTTLASKRKQKRKRLLKRNAPNKILFLVHDRTLIPAVKNYLQWMKLSVRVLAKTKLDRLGTNVPDVMILWIARGSRRALSAARRIRALRPGLKALRLIPFPNSKLQDTMKKEGVVVAAETEDLYRIYRRIVRLRRGSPRALL